MDTHDKDAVAYGNRWPELAVALILMVLGGIVVMDSIRVGSGWGEDGPKSGYFPFYIGLLLLGSSGAVFIGQLMRWKGVDEEFAERSQLVSVFSVLWPMVVYVTLIAFIGIYLPSAVLIAWFMLRHGKYRVALTAPVAIGVPVLFFLVFERWFLVPLPKGPIERMLGF